ncbi:MAG: hypothetical protein WCK67_01410 [bacterium]
MSLSNYGSFGMQNLHAQIGFGYNSTMKHVATKEHVHCAYGGEELTSGHPATAEHVKTHSSGGANSDSNFLPVCQEHNGERASIPFPKFLATHPKAWNNIKQTILELNDVKTSDFDGHKWAQNIVKVVEKESGRHMDITLGDDDEVTTRDYSSEIKDSSDNEEIDKTLTTRTGKKIYIGQNKPLDIIENGETETEPEIDKTLTTRSGKKIYIGENKPINFFA